MHVISEALQHPLHHLVSLRSHMLCCVFLLLESCRRDAPQTPEAGLDQTPPTNLTEDSAATAVTDSGPSKDTSAVQCIICQGAIDPEEGIDDR